jgi:hypothetical protein
MSYICTPEAPWTPTITARPVQHTGAHEVGEQEDGYPGGDMVTMECSNCGHRWKMELPQ